MRPEFRCVADSFPPLPQRKPPYGSDSDVGGKHRRAGRCRASRRDHRARLLHRSGGTSADPDPRQYLALFPALVRAFGGMAFAQGTAPRQPVCWGSVVAATGIDPDYAALEATSPVAREAEFAASFEERLATIRARLTGTCRSSASIRPINARAVARRSCGKLFANATGITCRLISNPATRPI